MTGTFSFSSSDRRRSLRMNISGLRLRVPGQTGTPALEDLSEFSLALPPSSLDLPDGTGFEAELLLPDGGVISGLRLGVFRNDAQGVICFLKDLAPETSRALDALYWDELDLAIRPDGCTGKPSSARRREVILDGNIHGLSERAFFAIRDFAHEHFDDGDILFFGNGSLTVKGQTSISGRIEDFFNTIGTHADPGSQGRILVIRQNKWDVYVIYLKGNNWMAKRLDELLPEDVDWSGHPDD